TFLLATSQRETVPSHPVAATVRPSGEMASHAALSVGLPKLASSRRESTSQTRITRRGEGNVPVRRFGKSRFISFRSLLLTPTCMAAPRLFPSGLKATADTPSNQALTSPVTSSANSCSRPVSRTLNRTASELICFRGLSDGG